MPHTFSREQEHQYIPNPLVYDLVPLYQVDLVSRRRAFETTKAPSQTGRPPRFPVHLPPPVPPRGDRESHPRHPARRSLRSLLALRAVSARA